MTDNTTEYRIEHDTMGEVRVPVDALWRAQTQRAVENFPISGTPIESAQIRALAQIKAACAKANAELWIVHERHGLFRRRLTGDDLDRAVRSLLEGRQPRR
jgi:fumarate hydratase class II